MLLEEMKDFRFFMHDNAPRQLVLISSSGVFVFRLLPSIPSDTANQRAFAPGTRLRLLTDGYRRAVDGEGLTEDGIALH
jgi:hypothetical protein